MILITIILIIIGSAIYTIIGNVIVRWLDNIYAIEINEDITNCYGEEPVYFVMGIFFPIILFYVLIKEVSIFIFDKFNER